MISLTDYQEARERLERLANGASPLIVYHYPDSDLSYSKDLRLLLSGPPVTAEEIARVIYDRIMDGPLVGDKPAWVEGGNSLKQGEARGHAQAVLALLKGTKP